MAGYTTDKDGNIINAGGIDVGYLAATQTKLKTEGIDTEQEIIDWYAAEGQKIGTPANFNEQLAREAGFQGTFAGNGTWEKEVEPFFAGGGGETGLMPASYYDDAGWHYVDQGLSTTYNPGTSAPDSKVWVGAAGLKDGAIYNEMASDEPLITSGNKTVLTGGEAMWDPDVIGSAAHANQYWDHRLINQQDSVRTVRTNFDEEELLSWQTFADAPYNVFSNFSNWVKDEAADGKFMGADYSAAERRNLQVGDNIGLGFLEVATGRERNLNGYTLNADQWATEAAPIAANHVKGMGKGSADPGYWLGGKGASGFGNYLDPTAWGDNPGMDQFATGGGPWSIGFRRDMNDFWGRNDQPVRPADHQRYQDDLTMLRGGGSGTQPSLTPSRDRFVQVEPDMPPPGNSTPRPNEPDEERNHVMSIFSNNSYGFPDPNLFTFR